jgi:2-oxoglutarate-Fe(II)-dependent oxygenase superfamily protein
VPDINFLNDVEGFLATWGRFVASGTSRRRVRKSANSAVGRILSCSHPEFRLALEPGVRDVVVALIGSLNCVTYSSCEGHRATPKAPAQWFHVGILARSPKEHTKLLRELHDLADEVNHRIGPDAPAFRIESRRLNSESNSWPCLDLVIVPNGLPEATYFSRLPKARRALLQMLSKHGGEGRPRTAIQFSGRADQSTYSRIVTALTTPSGSALRKRFRGAAPYPHLCFSALMTASEAMAVCSAIPKIAWNRVERAQYQFDAVDLLALSSRHGGLRLLIEALGSEQVRGVFSTVTGFPRLALDALHIHRMSLGQSVSVHTDSEGHSSAARLVIYLDDRSSTQGGIHLLLRERSRDYIADNYVIPRIGVALLFPMSRRSFHAVTALTAGKPRHTLVATYVSAKES